MGQARAAHRWAAVAAWLAVLALAAAEPARAQDALAGEEPSLLGQFFGGSLPEAPADQMIVDPLVRPAQSVDDPGMDYGADFGPGPAPVGSMQPVNWISGPYLKAGPTLVVGDDLLEGQDVGWTAAGGYRVPWGPAFDQRLFTDLGGSYLSAYGETTRQTVGQQTLSGVTTNINMATTLKEVKRGGVQAAFGWYWGDVIDQRSNDPQLRFATRLGGRWAHVRGRFEDVPLAFPPVGAVITNSSYGKTSTIGGLFVGTEAILLHRDTSIGSIAWTVDGEFSNDWIEFDNFESGSLGTASVMVGFMLSR